MSINDTLFTLTKELHDLQLQLNNAVAALDAVYDELNAGPGTPGTVRAQRLLSILKLERGIRAS